MSYTFDPEPADAATISPFWWWRHEYIVAIVTTLLVILIITFLLCAPLLFKHCPRFRNSFLFLTWIDLPLSRWDRLKDPEGRYGLQGAVNETLYVGGGQINLWRMDNTDSDVVIVYCHGNSCNRASRHRRELYSVLNTTYNLVTFDYRGFGDSPTEIPTNEDTVVEDAFSVLEWAVETYPGKKVVVWGHSLGTGVSVKLLTSFKDKLDDQSVIDKPVHGLVLESPFLNSAEAAHTFPPSRAYNLLPCTRGMIGESMRGLFPSDSLIKRVSVPIIILHAKDDDIIPVGQGEQLGQVAGCETRIYETGGHVWLCRDDGAMGAAREFIDRVTGSQEERGVEDVNVEVN
eukprot:sb/3466336/